METWSRYHCRCTSRMHQREFVEGSITTNSRTKVVEERCCECGSTYQTRTPLEPANE